MTPWNYLTGTCTADKVGDRQESIQLYDLLKRTYSFMVIFYEAMHIDPANYVKNVA
jgi:hypothetical protein